MADEMPGYAGCPVPTDAGIRAGDRAAYEAARMGSDMLRDRILAYHRRVQPHLFPPFGADAKEREAKRG